MKFRHGITVTVLAEQRNPVTGVITLVDAREIPGCGFSPSAQWNASAFRSDDSHAQVSTGRSLYTPPGSALTAGQRLRFPDGTLWEVDNDANPWSSPITGWTPGDHISVKRVTPP